MKIKVSEATPQQLDWLVERALGTFWSPNGYFEYNDGKVVDGLYPFTKQPRHKYSTDWAQGGPIIEREGINLIQQHDSVWLAFQSIFSVYGPTPLIAAMRCYCASKLGDEVEIPEELS